MQISSIDLSVVIPARNEEGYIEGALDSVARQRWPRERLEAIVVNNGSTDGTEDRVRRFMASHPHLAVCLVDEPLPGVARARNRGARAARGDWLVFLDADSRMAPDLTKRVISTTRRGFPAGCIRVIADSRDPLDRAFFGLMELGKALFRFHAQMFFCSRTLFVAHGGFDERLRLAEDREFLSRLQRLHVPLRRVRDSWIATSPRRLHRLPLRINMLLMLLRWALANWGIGRRWRY